MNLDTIIQAWIDFCRNALPAEWTVTRAEEVTGKDAPRPQGPYITLKIISGPRPITLDDYKVFNGQEEGNDNFDICGQRAYTLSINAFRSGNNDALSRILALLDVPQYYEQLKEDADIAVTNRGSVVDISSLLDTGFEGRSALDIEFNSSIKVSNIGVGLIESVQVEGELETEDGRIINTSDIINKE